MEFKKLLESTSQRDMCTAVPDDIVDLLICKTVLQTFLPLSVMQTHLYAQSLQWRSKLVCAVYWRSLSDKDSCLGHWTHRGRIFSIQIPFETAATQAQLSMYASQTPAFANRSVALHGLRSGCAISLAITGTKLDAIMDNVGWKSPSTAWPWWSLVFLKNRFSRFLQRAQ